MLVTRSLLIAAALALVVSLAVELVFAGERHRYFPGSNLTLYWAAFGFLSCVVIVVASKRIGHTFLMKHDDPYTGEHVEPEPTDDDRG